MVKARRATGVLIVRADCNHPDVKQQTLVLRTWGGKRPGAGRKPLGERRRIPHLARGPFRASQPVHVTLRVAGHVWNLRSERSYLILHAALDAVRRRRGFRVAHFSIQETTSTSVVEADGPGAWRTACGRSRSGSRGV